MFQNKEKISGHQALMLVLAGGIGNIFVVLAVPAIKAAGREGWLPVILGYSLAAIVGLILINLGGRFADKTFIQYLPVVWGKWLGKLIGLIYIFTLWAMAALVLREIMELMRYFMPRTPSAIIGSFIVFLIVYAMYKGFEVYARTAELLVVFVIVFILLLLFLTLPNTDWRNLTPMFEKGFSPVLKGLPLQFSYGLETLLFMALWFPCLNKKPDSVRAVGLGMSISGVLLTLLVAVSIAFTGINLTTKIIFPVFYMSRYILVADFLAGFEALFMLLWLSTSYLEILVFLYPPVVGLAQWLNLKDYKILILPMTVITLIAAIIPANVVEVLKIDSFVSSNIKLYVGLTIPLTWLLALLRGFKVKEA